MSGLFKHYGGGEIVNATPITTGPIFSAAEKFLNGQGCTLTAIEEGKKTLAKYPPGTTRQELYPRTTDIRYRIMLPSGRELLEVEGRGRGEDKPLISLQIVLMQEEQAEREGENKEP